MKRVFGDGITVGQIQEEIHKEFIHDKFLKRISRPTLYRLIEDLGCPPPAKIGANKWRHYTRDQVELIKKMIWEDRQKKL